MKSTKIQFLEKYWHCINCDWFLNKLYIFPRLENWMVVQNEEIRFSFLGYAPSRFRQSFDDFLLLFDSFF